MDFQSFDIKISDLPKTLDIIMPNGVNDESVNSLLESLVSQVEYNSRYEEENAQPQFEVKANMVEKSQDSVTVKIHAIREESTSQERHA